MDFCLSRIVKRWSAAGVAHVVVIVLGKLSMTFVVYLIIDICAAEIFGDSYSKKSPLPSIGNFSHLANSPKLSSYQVLGQSRIQQRHTTRYIHPRIDAQYEHIF
jgi:hypothetical protein